jgi:hypothetical protein
MNETPRTDSEVTSLYVKKSPTIVSFLHMAKIARELERELDFSEKTGRQIWRANERLQSELAAERDLADKLAETLDGLDWLAASPPQALAAWREARRDP